mgnify:CR=1 FL=1
MNVSTTGESRPLSYAEAHYQESLHVARKRVKEIRGFYISASMYAVIIPILWVINLSTGTRLWAQWATIGWGLGLVVQGLTVFAGRSFFGTEWEQKKVDEIMAREKLKVVSSEKQLMQAQMRMLQAQIEPHFLFNTLANIRSLVRRSGGVEATAMLDNLIAYLRAAVPKLEAEHATFEHEQQTVRAYLELMRMRMPDRLGYSLQVDPDALALHCPPMALLTLVENAIKHGIDPSEAGGRVDVRVAVQGQRVRVRAHDTAGNVGLTNARLAWEFLPLSFVYVVFTDTRTAFTVPGAPPSEQRLVVKATYTWRP